MRLRETDRMRLCKAHCIAFGELQTVQALDGGRHRAEKANVAQVPVARLRVTGLIRSQKRRRHLLEGTSFDTLDQRARDIGEPPVELSERVIRVEEMLSGVDARLQLVEKDLRALASKVDSHFIVLAGMIIALGLGLAGLMAKGFHWL